MTNEEQPTPPGWYPVDDQTERWWDGEEWSDDTHPIEPTKEYLSPAIPAPPVPEAATKKRRWNPGDYIFMGVLGVLFFGLPGITSATGSAAFNTVLLIGGVISGIWLLVGVISLAMRVGRDADG